MSPIHRPVVLPVALFVAFLAALPKADGQRAVLRPGSDPAKIPFWKIAGKGQGRPAIDATTVYFLSEQHEVLAVNAASGAIRWRATTGEAGPGTQGTTIVPMNSVIVVGDFDVIGMDSGNGQVKWRFAPTVGYAPGIYLGQGSGTSVYSGSADGRVFRLNSSNGVPVWTATVRDDRNTTVFQPIVDSDIVAAGYTVFTAPNTGGIIALDSASGVERWRTEFPRPSNLALATNLASNLLFVDDLIVATAGNGVIYGLSRLNGTIRWSIPAFSSGSSPAVEADYRALARTGRTLFAGSLSGYVVAYDLDTRQERWRAAGPPPGISVGFRIESDDLAVYVPYLGSRLMAFSVKDGATRWQTGVDAGAFSWPVLLVAGRLYAAGTAGFFALRR
jgi:outer membrane protein assembly factor BamB